MNTYAGEPFGYAPATLLAFSRGWQPGKAGQPLGYWRQYSYRAIAVAVAALWLKGVP